MMQCSRCHGEKGDGKGSIADLLEPRPRDFTSSMFKFRTAKSGELPTDEDLFRTFSRGVPGTAMPSWERSLPEAARRGLVMFIKTFAEEFSDSEFDPNQSVVKLHPKFPSSKQSIQRGGEVFLKNQCWECHGKELRGDGKTGMKDGWNYPIRVPNLNWKKNLRGGSNPEDFVYRFTTGMNRTPTPSFAKSINGNDRWHLANYIVALAQPDPVYDKILRAKRIQSPIPKKVDSKLWLSSDVTTISLRGQTLTVPGWINNSVKRLDVRVIYNNKEIEFLLKWDDPIKDEKHRLNKEVKNFTQQYVKAVGEIPREPKVFRDSIAIQFPVKPNLEHRISHLYGNPENPVNLWVWKSDQNRSIKQAVEDSNAQGIGQSIINPQSRKKQQVLGKGNWKNGRWPVIVTRPLETKDSDDIQFLVDNLIPVSFNIWDGSNGEHGLIMTLST